MLPAVIDVAQLLVDLRLLGLVAGRDDLLSQLLQVGFVLTEEVDLLHTVLGGGEGGGIRTLSGFPTGQCCSGLFPPHSCTPGPGGFKVHDQNSANH